MLLTKQNYFFLYFRWKVEVLYRQESLGIVNKDLWVAAAHPY